MGAKNIMLNSNKEYYPSEFDILKIDFGEVRIYNKEKTVCNMFRYRNKLEEDIVIEGLKNISFALMRISPFRCVMRRYAASKT